MRRQNRLDPLVWIWNPDQVSVHWAQTRGLKQSINNPNMLVGAYTDNQIENDQLNIKNVNFFRIASIKRYDVRAFFSF